MSLSIAFYAPMKPPDHETPSGDRTIARLLISALRKGGHRVLPVSRFRSWAATPERQDELRASAEAERQRAFALLSDLRPDIWLTYHLSYKAPDWLGPPLSARLGIPFLIAEASHAPSRAAGPWQKGVADVRSAIEAAQTVLLMKERDRAALAQLPGMATRLMPLPPFVDTAAWPEAERTGRKGPARLLAVAMLRTGAKLESFRLLAAALATVRHRWRLTIAGSGPARFEVRKLFAPFGDQVHFTGAVEGSALRALYHEADILVWPGRREGIGMACLEAQATGLPVIGCRAGGLTEVVRQGVTGLLTAPEPGELGAAIAALIADAAGWLSMGQAAAARVRTHHGMPQACAILDRALMSAEAA